MPKPSPASPRVVFVGGGSNAWTASIVRDMLLTPSTANASFVLYDIRPRAAETIARVCRRIAQRLGSASTFIATDDRPAAFRGADYFIITISTGGFDAMAHDLAIPEKFGVYHTVGDTSGPGGWARLIRNFDVFVDLADAFNRHAPNAPVLNYTNPMTALTDVLARRCKAPVIGLCHGLFENIAFVKEFYRLASEDELAFKYAGLNHFFWVVEARTAKVDVLADLKRRLKTRSFTDLIRTLHSDPMGFSSGREVATELFRHTGVMPYLGDRHTSEFFPWYVTSRANLKKYRLVRTTIAERRKGFATRQRQMERLASGKDPLPEFYVKRSRETAADIVDAHWAGKVFIDVGNVPNVGQVSNLPRGLVVETAVRIDRNGFAPIAFGDLPPVVHGFVEPYAHVFPMVVDACFQRDKALALRALRLDPVCSHLNTEQTNELGERLIAAHRKFVSAF